MQLCHDQKTAQDYGCIVCTISRNVSPRFTTSGGGGSVVVVGKMVHFFGEGGAVIMVGENFFVVVMTCQLE